MLKFEGVNRDVEELLAEGESVVDILSSSLPDYQVLVNYIVSLEGDLSDYAEPQGRITVK